MTGKDLLLHYILEVCLQNIVQIKYMYNVGSDPVFYSWCIMSDYGNDLRGRHFHVAELEGPPTAAAGEHDHEVPPAARGVAQAHVEAGLLLQERQEGHLPGDDHPQPLHMALQRQDHTLHGQTDSSAFLRHEVRVLPHDTQTCTMKIES
ncbi:uncharacterized protein CEXT_523951, partial [Caerostris extrusa]